MKAPSILKNKSSILKSINKIGSTPNKASYGKFEKNNIMSAINMMKNQQKEKNEVDKTERNRRMILP